MNAQFDFAFPRYPSRAGFKAAGTSQDAANAIEGNGRAARLRSAVLGFYAKHEGTPDECAAYLGESILSIRPRVSELFTQGDLMLTGKRRASSQGRSQNVLKLAPTAKGVAA